MDVINLVPIIPGLLYSIEHPDVPLSSSNQTNGIAGGKEIELFRPYEGGQAR